MKFALTSGTSTMDKGVETYVFGWNQEAVALYSQYILEGNNYRAHHFVCRMYTYPQVPEPEDVVSITITRGYQSFNEYHPDSYTVTLKIRRGHLTLAAFLKKHMCHPIQTIPIIDDLTDGTTKSFIRVHCMTCGVHQDIMDFAFPVQPRRWLDRS